MKEKLLTSSDFHNEWEKIGEKHDKIINCCGNPKIERRWDKRNKYSSYETALQQLLNKVDKVKDIAEEKIMNNLHPDEKFRRDDETEALLQLSLSIYRDIHSVQEDRVRVEDLMDDEMYDDSFPDDWVALCWREDECCKKTKNHKKRSVDTDWKEAKEEDCYFCN